MPRLKIIFTTIILVLTTSKFYSQITTEEFKSAVNFCTSKLIEGINSIPANNYPIRTKGIGEWELTNSSAWTSGFYPGCLWLANILKPSERFFSNAKIFTDGLEKEQFNTSTHDIGFMIFNSYGQGFKQTKDENYKKIILHSANSLARRFNEKTNCIQSWDGEFQVIIDNMMNLELLFWASKNGGGKNLYDIAVKHANTTIKNHLREDDSSFHVVVYDTSSGDVAVKRTHQGYSDSSSWARGQAWGIYGFTMCYRETDDINFLNTAIKMADYFIDNLPDDFIPYWDFCLPENSDKKFKDASAAAIALSALLELRNYVDDSSQYDAVIENIMESLVKNYLSINTESDGLVIHSAYNVNSANPFDHDASTIWGDYYFLESLLRYKIMFSETDF